MSRILSVLPHAGGNVAPTLEILGELRRRGHDVIVLGHSQLEKSVDAADLGFRPFRHARPWNATVEHPGWRSMVAFLPLASDRGAGRDVTDVAGQWHPDLVVVDCMLPGALAAARATGAPVAMVLHTMIEYWRAQWSPRSPLGLWLRVTGTLPGRGRRLPDLAILTTMPEFDPLPSPIGLLGNRIVQTGPALARVTRQSAAVTAEPTILISLSTISYPGQTEVLQRLVDATAGIPARVVVTTGPSLDPASIIAPPNVEVRRFVPHDELLRSTRLVIGHGGHGTTMRALAHGIPVVVVPMSSVADHHLVADAVVALGAGARVSKTASSAELRSVIADALSNASMREAAIRIADLLRERSGVSDAADGLETLVDRAT